MCRDVKYIILLYSSSRNFHTNTDATSHSVTTGNRWNQIKQQQWSVLIGCRGGRKPSEIKGDKVDSKFARQVEPLLTRRQEVPAANTRPSVNSLFMLAPH